MENLNEYQDSYQKEWKYFDDNYWSLSQYGDLMSKKIIEQNYRSVLSLGIGHNIVSQSFLKLLDTNLDYYHIVEGSSDIISSFASTKKSSKIQLFHMYFEEFNSDYKYDAIEMGFVLEHVDDPIFLINHFKNFLNDDGVIFIAVPNSNSLHRQIGFEAGLLDDLKSLSKFDLQLGHKRFFDLKSLEDSIAKAGMRVLSKKGLLLKPITGEQIKLLGWSENIINALLQIGLRNPELSNSIYIEAIK